MLRRIVIAAVAVCALGTVHIQAQKTSSSVPKKFGTTRKVTPSTLTEAVSYTIKVRTIGTVNTRSVRPSCPPMQLGALSHRRNRSKLLLQ